jgi:hypothetical protein
VLPSLALLRNARLLVAVRYASYWSWIGKRPQGYGFKLHSSALVSRGLWVNGGTRPTMWVLA